MMWADGELIEFKIPETGETKIALIFSSDDWQRVNILKMSTIQ